MTKKRAGAGDGDAVISFLSSQNVLRHAGEWVAVLDRRVIASGPDLVDVHRLAAQRARGRKPYYYAVPRASQMY